MSVKKLFNQYIKHTNYKEYVVIERAFICVPGKHLQTIMKSSVVTRKVFITTKSLKHVYDRHIFEKKTPRDFYSLLRIIKEIAGQPTRVYKNKLGKRGDFIFAKQSGNMIYMCTLELIGENEVEIVSAHSTGEKYLSKFTLLWS